MGSSGPLATSQLTDAGAPAGLNVYYVVTAVDGASQESGASQEACASRGAPAAPSGLTASAGDGQVDLDWADNAACDLAEYRVYRGTVSGGPYSQVASTLGSSHADSGLTNGVTYFYVVTAADAGGREGAQAAEVSAMPNGTPPPDFEPPVLSGIQAVDITDHSARIVWTTDEPADSTVEHGLDAGYGQSTFDSVLVVSHSVSLEGLAPATAYHFRVSSADSTGNASTSADGTFTTAPDSTPPAPPAGLSATAGDGQAALDWADNAESDLAGYLVYRSNVSGGPYSLTASPLASAHTDLGLTNGETYYYVVTAVDVEGNESAGSTEASATPADPVPPGPPVGLAASAGDDAVTLDWADGVEPDLAGYNVYRSTTSGSGFLLLNGTVLPASAYIDASVLPGGSYFYRLTAVDLSGNESSPSSEVSAGTPGFHLTFSASMTVPRVGGGTLTAPDEDIVRFDPIAGAYSLYFDGSAAGLASNQDIDGFDILSSGQILISLDGDSSVPGLGSTDDSDVLLWTPGSSSRYPGAWAWFFDGSDVGLSTSNEDVDAVSLLPDGRLLISTTGSGSAGGLSWTDEDILVFTFSGPPGAATSGTWAWHFDGSDVGLGDLASEDVWGVAIRLSGSAMYLTTQGTYSVAGLPGGSGADVLLFTPVALGAATSGTFALAFDGSASGLSDSSTIDGLDLAP